MRLGGVGSRIARRFLEAGHDVVVWNRTATKAKGFPRAAATAAEAARAAEVTITMLASPQALREVSATIEPRALIEMSTVGPEAVRELAERLPGVPLLDAPVLGSRSEAEAGTLHVYAGGPQDRSCGSPQPHARGSPTRMPRRGAIATTRLCWRGS